MSSEDPTYRPLDKTRPSGDASAIMATASPAAIGSFRIIREIGRGGMGVVYLAQDSRLDRLVAIKAIIPEVANDPGRLAMFRDEARLIAQMNHPHIAQIHQLVEDDGRLFLVMEYVPGRSLREAIRAGISPGDGIALLAQIADALESAHRKRIVHRDLKPENVRLTDDGTAKVLDFGLAQALSAQDFAQPPESTRPMNPASLPVTPGAAETVTHAGPHHGVIGTPGYMAPEQCRGEPVDARADVFAFGCLMYECLCGQPAYSGGSVSELIEATLTTDADLGRLPRSLRNDHLELVRHCLERNRDNRRPDLAGVSRLLGGKTPEHRHRAAPNVPNNLPHQRDHFIGRGQELDELTRILEKARLVTLTGSGGCGKTRLAAELGHRLLERFDGGVWLTELAATSDSKLVPSAVAMAIGAWDQPNKSANNCLAARIADSKCLLILDNCEHVLDAVGVLAGALLDACSNLRVVVTSREALGIRGELAWRVPSLAVPGENAKAQAHEGSPGTPGSGGGAAHRPTPPTGPVEHLLACESVALFVERAREVRPAFALNDANASAVASICRRLDGIPLAIELAAARVSVLTPEQIESRLRDRFKLLRAGRGKAERHQTLRAAIDWSWRLLASDQQRVLRFLAVFAGGCDLDGACAVVGGDSADEFEVLDLLTHLAAKSLLLTEEFRGQTRYRLLETVRQYAFEELDRGGEACQAFDRHLAYFEGLAGRAEPEIMGPRQAAWLDRLDGDADNLMAAIEHGCRSQPQRAQRMCGDLWRFWQIRGHVRAGVEACTNALAAGAAPTSERVAALIACVNMLRSSGDLDATSRIAEELLAAGRELDHQKGVATALNSLGIVAHHRRAYPDAKRLFTESLTINRRIDRKVSQAANLGNLGELAREMGDFAAARQHIQESMDICRQLGIKVWEAGNHYEFGAIAREEGDLAEARRCCAASIEILRSVGDRHIIFRSVDEAAMLAALAGQWTLAARLEGASSAQRERTGITRELRDQRDLDRYLIPARTDQHQATGSDDAWTRAVTEGRALGDEQAIDMALGWLLTPATEEHSLETGSS